MNKPTTLKVRTLSRLQHDGVEYAPKDVVEMSLRHAQPLVAGRFVEPADAQAEKTLSAADGETGV